MLAQHQVYLKNPTIFRLEKRVVGSAGMAERVRSRPSQKLNFRGASRSACSVLDMCNVAGYIAE